MSPEPWMEGYRSCRVVIGNEARVIPEEERVIPELTHEWKAYVRAPLEIVKKVEFKLHESFSNRLVSSEHPFEVVERGWGEFSIQIKIFLFNGEKVLTSHFLQLHGDSDVVISERVDEIVFRDDTGSETIASSEEEAEYKRIEAGIVKMIQKLKDVNG